MKLLCVILIVYFTCIATSLAEEEQFTIRDGIFFGMSIAEVKKAETEKLDRDVTTKDGKSGFLSYYPVKIAGNDDCVVEYHFEDGELYYIYYGLSNEETNKSKIKRAYSELSLSLVSKYGKPLGFKNGETSQWTTNALDSISYFISSAKAFKESYSYEYEEWLIPQNQGAVKIDHLYFYGSTSRFHWLGFQMFSINLDGI